MSDLSRRHFLQAAATAAAAPLVARGPLVGADAPSNRLNLAIIGPGGRGKDNLKEVAKSQNIVALCDVDDERAGEAYEKFPKAARFTDFRKMFDKMEKGIDAVVISTPDHTHFHPAYWALTRGKHVYLEKPLAHNVWEVRELTQLAARKKLATQLGAQRHTLDGLRAGVEVVKAGVIGSVSECHCWIDSDRGMPATPTKPENVPATLQWDMWQGPVPQRGYSKAYVPYNWRFWWDYGTGETGNWGCHILDIPYWALDLAHPVKVSGSGPKPDARRTPKSMHAVLEYPARGKQPAVTLHWYQAKGGPAILKKHKLDPKGMNTLFVGSQGMLLCGFGRYQILPEEKAKDFKLKRTLPKSPGFYKEWFIACKGGQPATCNFNYSGPMAEAVLLANVAYRVQGGFAWDAAGMKAKGNDQVRNYLRSAYRKGWEV